MGVDWKKDVRWILLVGLLSVFQQEMHFFLQFLFLLVELSSIFQSYY